jgi:hypothetical protein
MQDHVLEKPTQIYLREKVREMAWLPFPGVWRTEKINKEINSLK